MSELRRAPLSNRRAPDQWIETSTPSGDRIFVAFSANGISFVAPATDSADFVMRYFERTGRMATAASAEDHQGLIRTIRGGRTVSHQCDLEDLSPFTRRVLEATCEIPLGETRSYDWIANSIGMPDAARAVENALASNPVPMAIPCHRVLGRNGELGEYALGRATKRALLAAEGLEIPVAA
ncbi:MAG: MGMT family protein [Solirubrobacterales bacterium]|nr:MGMT family protein [Solirubrobacterales bacterium]